MIQYNAAFIVSMYDEYQIVLKTLMTVNKSYKNPTIIVVRSDDGTKNDDWYKIRLLATNSITLPNLAKKHHHLALPAYAVTRNFSVGFSLLNKNVDYIVALLGDTLINNPKPLHRKAEQMLREKKYLSCCKAYGQYFHSKESSASKIVAKRFQGADTTDFSAVLFIFDGNKFQKTKCFSKMKVTNKYCSEQCLGDETLRHFSKKEILEKTNILNSRNPTFCYDFTDGITYHAVTGKPGR